MKPIYVMHDDVSQNVMNAVKSGITHLLRIANASQLTKIIDYGFWTQPEWEINGALVPYASVLWYLKQGDVNNSKQLDVERIIDAFRDEPWRQVPHFDVLVTSFDLNASDCNFCIGYALPGIGAVISTARWEEFSDQDQFQLIKTETMHEVGHVFGLPNSNRSDIEYNLGGHCQKNGCIMRQGEMVPRDWVNFTNQSISSGRPLCPTCERDLRNFFR